MESVLVFGMIHHVEHRLETGDDMVDGVMDMMMIE